MKTMNLKSLVLASLSALALTAASHAQTVEDPFAGGTGIAVGTAAVERDIHEFALQSRGQLNIALTDTLQARPDQAVPRLVAVMQNVVVRSYRYSRGRETLFRNVISQALELVGGLPAAGGRPARPGILDGGSIPIELKYEILRDTVTAAIHLTDQDAAATEVTFTTANGMVTALDLPYVQFATARVGLAGVVWGSAVRSLGLRQEFLMLQTVLQQWVNIVLAPAQTQVPAIAALVDRVRAVLCETSLQPCLPVESGVDPVTQEMTYNMVRPEVSVADAWTAVNATDPRLLASAVFRLKRHIINEMVGDGRVLPSAPAYPEIVPHIQRYHPFTRSSDFHAWMTAHWAEFAASH